MERNKSKRNVGSSILAGMLVMLLCMTASVSVLAGTGGTAATPQKAVLTKNLRYADGAGLSTPTANFTYTFTKVSLDGSNADADLTDMPTLGPAALSFSSADTGTLVNGMQQVSKTIDVLSGVTWTRTGVYEYTVTEDTTGFTPGAGENIIYSQAEFTLYVVVAYDSATDTYFPEISYTEKTKNDDGSTSTGNDNTDDGSTDTGKGDPNDTSDPNYNFIFTNIYTKKGGSTPGSEALKITKQTTGTGSDPTKLFTFTLTADDSGAGILTAGTYTGTYTPAGGSPTTVSLTADGSTPLTFTLASGDTLVFADLPAGTTFVVEETGTASYIPSYTGTTAEGAISATGTVAENLSTGTQKIGAANNTVDYTNTFDSSLIPTGILNNVAPVVALLAVIVLAFIAFAAMNRRRAR